MGCNLCSTRVKKLEERNGGQKIFSGSIKYTPVNPQPPNQVYIVPKVPYFMSQQIYSIISERRNIFEGIQPVHNGVQVVGKPMDSWVPAGQGFVYKGQWQQQKKHGIGLLYLQIEGSVIAGCFYQNDLLLNNCRKFYPNGTQYLGQLNQVYEMHGVGKVVGKTFTYQGQLKKDRFDGKGVIKKENYQFKGDFKYGQKKYGIQTTPQGTYQGPYKNNKKEGQGIFKWANGGRYEGPFVKNKMHGIGKLYDADGNYCGKHTFQEGKRIF